MKMSRTLSYSKSVMMREPEYDLTSEREQYFEDTGNWRKIIFLPFKIVWRIIVVATVLLDCWLVTYTIGFSSHFRTSHAIIYYICECIYFTDVVLTILHKYMIPYQKTQTHLPKNSYFLVIDLITLVPYYEVYYILNRSSKGKTYKFSKDYLKMKVFLRTSNIALFLHHVNSIPGLNHVLITTAIQMVLFFLYQAIVSAIFYNISVNASGRKWTDNLIYHNFNNESLLQWMILTNALIGNVLAHNWPGIIKPENIGEELIFAMTMVLGFLIHIMIFFGELTALYIKKMADQFDFSSKLYVIAQMLDDWNVPSKTKKEAIDKYNKFWEKRYGRKTMPPSFYSLPKTLRSDCGVDVFWHCFKHSHLFSDIEFPVLKNLSLRMRNEFYMPGEYLYRFHQPKTKMFYIVSGVVEVVGQDERGSSIISFSGGTVLGEISCLMILKSVVNIRCATYCTVQTLEINALAKMMRKYNGISKKLYNTLNLRFQLAKEMQHEELTKLKNRIQKRTSVKWIKQQWRSIYSEHKTKSAAEERYQQVTLYHTSRFLGLYVLSDDVELKKKVICLRSTCPYLMESASSFRVFCEYIILGAVLIQSLLLPYLCFFPKKFTHLQTGWLYMLDLIFVFGIYLDLSTVVKSNRKTITNLSQIIIYRGKQISTLLDIFSTLPLEIVGWMISMRPHTVTLLRLNRVLRVYKVFRLIDRAELNVWVNYLQIRLIKYFLLFFYTLYFVSSLLFGLSCFNTCDPNGWLAYNTVLKLMLFSNADNISHTPSAFLLSLDYTASRLLSLTWGHNYAYSIPDIIMEYFVTLLGYYLFSFCFAELAACSVLQLEIRNKYQRYIKGLKFFATRTKIPAQLKNFMYDMVKCHWCYNKRYDITGPDSIVKDMPENLRYDILISRIVRCLKTIPFFMEVEEDFICSVAKIARLNVVPPGTIIMREEVPQQQLHVILRGYCSVESSIPTDKYHEYVNTFSYGDCFPLMELFLGVNSFLKATSLTTIELLTINYDQLMTCIKAREMFKDDLDKVLEEHMEAYYIVLTRQKGRLPEMVAGQKSLGKGDYFVYDVNDKIKADMEKAIFYKTFHKLGQWEFLRYFLLRRTIEPTGKFFVIWEIFRGIIAGALVLYTLFAMKFYLRRKGSGDLHLRRFIDIFLVVDLYVRLHIRYYDEKGIKITHPLHTAYYYIKTSFLLDLICIFPIQDLDLHTMFGIDRRYHVLMLIYTLIKPLTLHRVFNALSYLQEESKQGRAMLYQNIRYVGLVLVVLGIFSSMLEIVTCWDISKTKDIFYSCPNDSWITMTMDTKQFEHSFYTASILCCYAVLSIFATCTVGLFRFQTSKEMIIIFILAAGLFGLRWFVLAKITSSRISGDRKLVHYQHNMKVFLGFMKKYCPNSPLQQETVAHYEYVWKKTKGHKTTGTLKNFHSVLKADLSFYLYATALKLTYVFNGIDNSTMRFISTFFDEYHYKKDAEIIRCNDINNYIYVVYKGHVDITVANDKLSTLTIGGMFGCFAATKDTRQTITAKAKYNVDLLRIKNTKFNELLHQNSKMKHKIVRERFLKTEYMLPYDTRKSAKVDIASQSSNFDYTVVQTWRTFLINPTNPYYMVYNYIINVHLATISSLFIMTLVVTTEHEQIVKYHVYIYLLDAIFSIKICIGFHVTYLDQDSGLFVTQYSRIWRRYLKSLSGFWLDLATVLPFELIAYFVFTKSTINYFLMNRTCRVLFLIKYYTNCKNTLTVSRHLRWTYLVYLMILLPHVNACIWWLVACPHMKCSYYKRISHEPYVTVVEQDTMGSFRLAYLYVINVFTSTGLKIITPSSNAELIATIVMVCVAQYILIALTAGFASMLVQDKSVMTQFEREAGHVLKYAEAAGLSLSLKNRIWNYYVMLWTRAQGPWLPKLITDAPPYLKEDIMGQLYGKHLLHHFLFKRTHVDFQRQLVARLDVEVFLPGMYIAQKGDVDNCMFFIDEGEVIVYDKIGKSEVEHLVLDTGKSFGEAQCLFGLPHDRSYKARFTSRIIILNKKKWRYLLHWFPASKEQIEENATRRLRMQTVKIDC